MALTSSRSISVTKTEAALAASKRRRVAVTTISWTSTAAEPIVTREHKVHRNIYHWTLPFLIRWIRETADVHEEIIQMEPVPDGWVEDVFPRRAEGPGNGCA